MVSYGFRLRFSLNPIRWNMDAMDGSGLDVSVLIEWSHGRFARQSFPSEPSPKLGIGGRVLHDLKKHMNIEYQE